MPVNNSTMIGPLMLDVEGMTLTHAEKITLSNPLVGGLILFSRNYASPEQLTALVAEIRDVSPNIVIAVDHEGGRVQRFKKGFTHAPAMSSLGVLFKTSPEDALAQAKELGWLIAAELLAFDVDLSFTPVLDRDHGVSNVIGDRAFSQDGNAIVALTSAFIDGMHEAGMIATGKHFPGHGGVAADSHHEIPVDPRSMKVLDEDDLHIFRSLISNQQKVDALMPAHVIYSTIDRHPAGFSKTWLQSILRQEMAFDGIIFSDDLSMEGASVAGSFSERAEAAISAGCDMVLVCNHPEGAQEVLEYLESIVKESPDKFLNSRLTRLRFNVEKRQNLQSLQNSNRWKNVVSSLSSI